MKYIARPLGITLQGFYKVAVVDTNTGQEVWRQPDWKKNLILNNGMDAVAATPFNTCMRIGIAGLGDRMNFITSSASQGSIINGFLYLDVQPGGIQDFSSSIYEGYTGSLYTGDVVRFLDGTEVMITSSAVTNNSGVVSDLSASIINTASVVSTQSFTIWKTSQTGLQYEVRRAGTGIATSSYLDLYNGTNFNAPSGTFMHYRTYDFGSESISRSYTEVGVGFSAAAQSRTVFSRIRLPAPVTLSFDQRLRMVYGLFVQYAPTASIYVPNATITGWPVAPSTNTNTTQSIQVFNNYTLGSTVGTNGDDTTTAVGAVSLEPWSSGANSIIWASANSQSLYDITGSLGPIDRIQSASSVNSIIAPYVCGSFTQYKYGTLGLNDSNSDRLYFIGVGTRISFPLFYNPWYETPGYAVRFDHPQTKTDTQTLTLNFKWTWARVLAN